MEEKISEEEAKNFLKEKTESKKDFKILERLDKIFAPEERDNPA